MVIMHNLSAMNANRQLGVVNVKRGKSAERLGSGYRINRAADDAAGLSISEKMRHQIRGLNRASDNAQDGISYIQTAEGALNEMHAIMNRCNELCVQGANDTNTEADRQAIQEELDELVTEIDRIADTTQYNTLNVFEVGGTDPFAMVTAGAQTMNEITIVYSFINEDGTVQISSGVSAVDATNYTGDAATIADYVVEQAGKAASAIASAYPSLVQGSSPGIKVGLNLANIDGASGTLASAALAMSWSSVMTNMSFTLNIDTSDYNIGNYNDGSLAETIAHEMMHLIMQDALTAGMLGKNSEEYPQWFVEGTAQSASGDNGWMSSITTASTDAEIQTYLGKVTSMPYGAGYLATLYLAQLASGNTAGNLTGGSLRSGMNTIFEKLLQGYTLSQIINDVSGGKYTTYQAYQSGLKNDADALTFTKAFVAERDKNGTKGEGSVVASNIQGSVADTMSSKGAYSSYIVDSSAIKFTNTYNTGFTFPDLGNQTGTGGGGTGTGGVVNTHGDLHLQVGAVAYQNIDLITYDASANALLKGKTLNVMTHQDATESITTALEAIEGISAIRSYYGAVQNRLEHTIANLDNIAENTQASESVIRDTDMAEEMVAYSAANILAQSGQAMLAQANNMTNGVLQLLQ